MAPTSIWKHAHIHIHRDNQIVACIEGQSLAFTTHDVVCWAISKYQSEIIKLMYE